jgi:hypothetical protein
MNVKNFETGDLYSVGNKNFFSVMFFTAPKGLVRMICLEDCDRFMHDGLLYLGQVKSKNILTVDYGISDSCYKFLTDSLYVYSFTSSWIDPIDYEDIKKISG